MRSTSSILNSYSTHLDPTRSLPKEAHSCTMSCRTGNNACPRDDCLNTKPDSTNKNSTPLLSKSGPAATTRLDSATYCSSSPPNAPLTSTCCSPMRETSANNKFISDAADEAPTTSTCLTVALLDTDGDPTADQSAADGKCSQTDKELGQAPNTAPYTLATSSDNGGASHGVEGESGDGSEEEEEEEEDEYDSDEYGRVEIRVTTRQHTTRARSARPLPPGMRYRPVSRVWTGRNNSRKGQGKARERWTGAH
ncbi:hypothetical protein CPC08DRAFT_210178 [Agrocybe pediades]|nr:hypothetical protein CPC08DRAFT_210178 [Agrocybe pediades]